MEIERLEPNDRSKVSAVAHLFDGPAREDATDRFLSRPGHHLLVAYENGDAVGFVSGVEMTHPDKGTEMLLYELAVEDGHQRRCIGKRLVEHLSAIAQEAGCYGMWVLTDDENEGAKATYTSGGGTPSKQLLFAWTF